MGKLPFLASGFRRFPIAFPACLGALVLAAPLARGSEPPARSTALEINPLSLLIERVSVSAEQIVGPHFALVATLHGNFGSPMLGSSCTDLPNGECAKPSYRGGGTELGFRLYSGTSLDGFFVGPSLLVAGYRGGLPGQKHTFAALGGAVDAGWQVVTSKGAVLGAGLGLLVTRKTRDYPADQGSPPTDAADASPRVLLSIGYCW